MDYSEQGWIYPDNRTNNIHLISEEDINQLLSLADEEDAWSERVREEVKYKMQNPSLRGSALLLDEFRIMNIGGTIIQYPYGDRIITFNSKRHFYRGENQVFPYSLPSLNRKLIGKDKRQQELYRAVANLRIIQFYKFIWNINVVPYWEAKLSDINYKALAQHYGFETHLMDLTNDFRVALFFATCKYISETDSYIPLTDEIIESKDENKYGVIYHSPNWALDYISPGASLQWNLEHMNDKRDKPYGLDSGDLDGMAFQIGYQPLMRCHHQSGYIFPMRNKYPLQADNRFEILHFKQSPELSQRVFEMMGGGKKVFPYEGISEAKNILDLIKKSTVFSEDDITYVYNFEEVDKVMFPTIEDFKRALTNTDFNKGKITIKKGEIEYPISQETLCKINNKYDGNNLLAIIGGMIHQKPEDRRYREQRCIDIYGKLI
ncbi:FRG domain-containing protein [Clostridium tyrobutyricum]|uniref:FRG domain-containing protein n=1 Tax=Clostridium tyrobutyricum TaxID=1519 RepID=UPI0018A044D3|nr:FRG domain-containing protein [Clostridium tyrobutyricum]